MKGTDFLANHDITLQEIGQLEDMLNRAQKKKSLAHVKRSVEERPLVSIIKELGPASVQAYFFADEEIGPQLRDCGNPKVRHSFDSGAIAHLLHLNARYVKACLLHDVTEEVAGTIGQAAVELQKIGLNFGPEMRHYVGTLTNFYEILINQLTNRIGRDDVRKVRASDEMTAIETGLDGKIFRNAKPFFQSYVNDIRYVLAPNSNIATQPILAAKERVNLSDLEKATFPYFIERIVIDAEMRRSGGDKYYDVSLCARLLEQRDNGRTLPSETPAAETKLYKLRVEVPIIEDYINQLNREGHRNNMLTFLLASVKLNFVESLDEVARISGIRRDAAYRSIKKDFEGFRDDFMKEFNVAKVDGKFKLMPI
jgi:hypothetical protein